MQPELILKCGNRTAPLSTVLWMLPFLLKEKGFKHALLFVEQVWPLYSLSVTPKDFAQLPDTLYWIEQIHYFPQVSNNSCILGQQYVFVQSRYPRDAPCFKIRTHWNLKAKDLLRYLVCVSLMYMTLRRPKEGILALKKLSCKTNKKPDWWTISLHKDSWIFKFIITFEIMQCFSPLL